MRSLFLMSVAMCISTTAATAQPLQPANPDQYDIHLRYRIRADRDGRVVAFRALTAHLKSLGFAAAPRDDADLDIFDTTAEKLNGSISSANIGKLFDDASIRTAILMPAGQVLPEDAAVKVPVQIRIAAGLGLTEQRLLHSQISMHLTLLGFVENLGYDHREFTRLRGVMNSGDVLKLLKDLRTLPSGWFGPAIQTDQLPAPFRNVLPIRVVEVLPIQEMKAAAPAAAAGPAIDKLGADVKAILADAAAAEKPINLELILEAEPNFTEWQTMRDRIRSSAAGVSVEGLIGRVVSVRLQKAADLAKLAGVSEVAAIRTPRTAVVSAFDAAPNDQLNSGILQLHQLGYRGRGAKVVVVGSDFSGYLASLGNGLPKTARLLDLTGELNPELLPAPSAEGTGVGLRTALQLAAAAPDAELILVRIDRSSLHQLTTLANAVTGEETFSEAMQSRAYEIRTGGDAGIAKRAAVAEEYRKAFADLSDEDKPRLRREAARKAFDDLLNEDQQTRGRIDRFNLIRTGLESLKRTTLVLNTLTWNTGYPQDGLSELSRLIEAKFTPVPQRNGLRALNRNPLPAWIQSAAEQTGQIWAGPFLDADGNGAMEFAAPEVTFGKERWTHELNFLRASGKEAIGVLNGGTKLRFTIQWREPQDPDGYVLRDPSLPLQLILLRQLDPAGKTRASDDFEEVARSGGNPVKLLRTAASSAYEQTLELTLPTDGVYALRVEGKTAFESLLPALRQKIEVNPRIVVESMDTKPAPLLSIVPMAVGVGIPADSTAVLTVGGINAQAGFGPGVVLNTKPDVRGPIGTIGGMAALLGGVGLKPQDLVRTLGLTPGGDFMIPQNFLNALSRPRGER